MIGKSGRPMLAYSSSAAMLAAGCVTGLAVAASSSVGLSAG